MSGAGLKERSAYRLWTNDTIRCDEHQPDSDVDNGAVNRCLERGRVRFRDEHLAHLREGALSGFALVKCTIEYHETLRFSAEVNLGTTITRLGGSSYTLVQGIFVEDRCIATAHSIFVRMDPDSAVAMPLDEAFRDALRQATGFGH